MDPNIDAPNNGELRNEVTQPASRHGPTDDISDLIQRSAKTVVLTGAGISAESGLATFRDALTGLWERFDAEQLATPEAFERDPELVWGWYESRRAKVTMAKPNDAHLALAQLEAARPQTIVVTQNVDNLHERAGSRNVLHLHGSLFTPRCERCGSAHLFDATAAWEPEEGRPIEPPRCTTCGGRVRPGVVWFGEPLPAGAWRKAEAAASACDLLLVVGTSGLVQPAASLPWIARQTGASVVVIDPHPTAIDEICTRSLRGKAAEVLPHLVHAALA